MVDTGYILSESKKKIHYVFENPGTLSPGIG